MLLGLAYDSNRRAAQAELDNPPMGRMIDLSDGSRLHYVERGSGPPVLLITWRPDAGGGHGDVLARPAVGKLSHDRHRPSRSRLQHASGQFASPQAASMAGQARMIHEAMRIIGVEKPIIVGHSLGGTVALAYAVQFPEHISGIVSLAGYCFPTPRFDLMPIMLNGVPIVGPISAHTVSAIFGRLYLSAMINRIFAPNPIPDYFQDRFPGGMLLRPRQLCAMARILRQWSPAPHPCITGTTRSRYLWRSCQAPKTRSSGRNITRSRFKRPLPTLRWKCCRGSGHMLHHIQTDAVITAVHRMVERVDERAREFALAG